LSQPKKRPKSLRNFFGAEFGKIDGTLWKTGPNLSPNITMST